MNKPFKEHWLIQAEPESSNTDLMVYFLMQRDGQWLSEPKCRWLDFVGSTEALHAMSDSATEFVLNLHGQAVLANPNGPAWCALHNSPNRSTAFEFNAQHRDVVDELKRHGLTLRTIHCAKLNDWQNSTQYIEVKQHEARIIHQWIKSITAPKLQTVHWLGLAVRLYLQGGASHARSRIGMTALAFTLLCAIYATQGKPEIKPKAPTAVSTDTRDTIRTTTAQAWPEWQQQHKRLGENNVEALHFAWRPSGAIHSQITLQKPRKRLPKGCEQSQDPRVISCITQGQSQ